MTLRIRSFPRFLSAVSIAGVMYFTTLEARLVAADSPRPESAPPATSFDEAKGPDELFSKLLERNHLREARLEQYSATRIYEVTNDKGKLHAKAIVHVQFRAPSTKTFTTASEEGSWVVRHLVFRRLMESEVETAAGRGRQDSAIKPENYALEVVGKEDLDGRECLVVDALPTRKDKYLFEGRVWIDARDFAVAKIVGHPAKNPSFWIKRVDFVRQYQKIGEFWLPLKDVSTTELKIHGKKILTIDHRDYAVNGAEATKGDPKGAERGGHPTAP